MPKRGTSGSNYFWQCKKKPVLILHIPHLSTWVSKMIPSWGFIHVRKQRLGNIFRHSYTHYPHITYPCSRYKKIGKADKIKILFVGGFRYDYFFTNFLACLQLLTINFFSKWPPLASMCVDVVLRRPAYSRHEEYNFSLISCGS